MKIKLGLCIIFSLFLSANQALALQRGPTIAYNILGGAGAGTAVGLSAGMLAYGFNNNYDAQMLLTGAVYGFLGGAVLGTGIGVYEIYYNKPDTGFTVAEYLIGGTGIGALVGLVVATIPNMRDKDPEDYTIGLGLGGLIGATCGSGLAILDISARSNDSVILSGKIGIQPDSRGLIPLVSEKKREPVLCCKIVELQF